MQRNLLVCLYSEHGGKRFFEKSIKHLLDWLDVFSIMVPNNPRIVITSFSEFFLSYECNQDIYAIFFCPGSLIGSGKECFPKLLDLSEYVIGCCDHYTNPWQRFSDESSGLLFAYLSSYLVVRSERCVQRVLSKGYNGHIHVFNLPNPDPPLLKRNSCCKINTKSKIVFVTEWYDDISFSLIPFDQESYAFQDFILGEYSKLMKLFPTISFGARKHPHLIDIGWNYPQSLLSNTNFTDLTHTPIETLVHPSSIFVGIHSNLLLEASSQGCLSYTIDSGGTTFDLSQYNESLIKINSIFSLSYE